MATYYLETARLRFREMRPDEAAVLFDLDGDPEVMKYLSGGKATDMETCEKSIQKICEYYSKYGGKFGLWFAEEREGGEIIGWFLLRPDKEKEDSINHPELGYRLKRKFWGKGYATEGARALMKKAFVELNVKSVFAVTLNGNVVSRHIMKKIGMKFVGDFHQTSCFDQDQDSSAVEYEISKDEWLKVSHI